jgi:HlyD family secretion protein
MKTRSRRILPIVGAAVVAAALVYAFLPRPVEVDVASVDRGPLEVTVLEDGKTRIKDRYVVASPLAGKLERIRLRSGDAVTADKDLIAVIVPSDPDLLDPRARAQAEAKVHAAEALKNQVEAQLQRARVNHEYAKVNLERANSGFAAKTISHQELDDAEQKELSAGNALREAEFAVQVTAFELEQARAVLLRAGSDTGAKEWRHEIQSPITGKVLRVFQESSTIVTPGTKLIELGDPSDLEIEADVLSTDGVQIEPGARVSIEHWGGPQSLRGRVRLVEPSGFTKVSALGVEEQRVNVIIDFADKPADRATLGDAFRVEARIVIWENPNVLRVPAGALFRSDGKWAVFVIDNNRAVLRLLSIGRSNDDYAEVLEGLRESDRVVIYPTDRVQDGVKVKPRT